MLHLVYSFKAKIISNKKADRLGLLQHNLQTIGHIKLSLVIGQTETELLFTVVGKCTITHCKHLSNLVAQPINKPICIACCRKQQNVHVVGHKDTQISEGIFSLSYETWQHKITCSQQALV